MCEESDIILLFKKKLEKLKEEESFILELLRDVQKQLSKYKIEALHMSHLIGSNDAESDKLEEDESSNDNLLTSEMLDRADIINCSRLNLDLNKANNEEEELDDTDFSD